MTRLRRRGTLDAPSCAIRRTFWEENIESILTRCGFRCDLCLAYRPNITQHPENRQKLSDGWFKYFGFRLPLSEICCDGCMADNHTLDEQCRVRPCVTARGLDNCAACDQYVCDKLADRLVNYDQIKARLGAEIPDDDRRCFIQPYENERRLEAIREARGRGAPQGGAA